MIFLFFSAFLYSVNNLLWKVFVRNVNPFYLIAKRAVFTVAISLGVIAWIRPDLHGFLHSSAFPRALVGSVFGAFGLVFLVYSFKLGTFVNYGHYELLGGAVAGIFTFLFESVPVAKYIPGTVIILSGFLLFLSTEKKQGSFRKGSVKQHLTYTAMLSCFSVMGILNYLNLKTIEPLVLVTLQEMMVLLVTSVVYLFFRRFLVTDVAGKVTHWQTLLMAIIIFLAVLTGSTGLKVTNLYIAWILGFLSPVMTVLFGLLFFREKISIRTAVSLGMILAGTFFL